MARIQGIDPKRAPLSMRFIFQKVRKMAGRDLTPMLIGARVPRVFWLHGLAQWLLFEKTALPKRQGTMVALRTAARVGCPF
ncbi:MAG TPA: hypothetical protein VGZ02_07855 [Candidatus Baltobacteraceae bacterium]|jgi:hypothetical protein|nr:hypothetical protein [Candidatus Baltobacteraceae bacterium]